MSGTEKTTEKTEGETLDFSSAFTQFAADEVVTTPAGDEQPKADDGEQPKAGEGEGAAGDEEQSKAGEGDEEQPKAGEGEGAAGEGDEEQPKADDGKPAPKAAPKDEEDIIERFARIVADKTKETPAQPVKTQQEEEPPLFTKEEQEAVEEYLKDYGEVERGAALIRRAEYQQVTKHIFNEIGRALAPFIQNAQAMIEQVHLQNLRSSVEDYDTIYDKVIEWAENQPAYLKSAYKRVIQEGTQEEIVDLIERFRKDTGSAPPAPANGKTNGGAQPEKTKATELPAAAKKAAAALAPVSTKRSNVSAGVDPADFDSAFAAFASKET